MLLFLWPLQYGKQITCPCSPETTLTLKPTLHLPCMQIEYHSWFTKYKSATSSLLLTGALIIHDEE